jgi:hypothetical protein
MLDTQQKQYLNKLYDMGVRTVSDINGEEWHKFVMMNDHETVYQNAKSYLQVRHKSFAKLVRVDKISNIVAATLRRLEDSRTMLGCDSVAIRECYSELYPLVSEKLNLLYDERQYVFTMDDKHIAHFTCMYDALDWFDDFCLLARGTRVNPWTFSCANGVKLQIQEVLVWKCW